MKETKLTYEEAMASPCAACKPCPCCYMLHLDEITANTLMDLDKVNFYLNFDNIEICLTLEGQWIVYYNYHCQYYDAEKATCRLHDAGQKTNVCAQYNPYSCFYKRLRTTRQEFCKEMIWINRDRMDFIMSQISFDQDRNISDIPELGKLYEAVSLIPYNIPGRVEAPKEDKRFIEWKQSVVSKTNTLNENEAVIKSHLDFQNPCKDCDSYCCQNLLSLQQIPTTYAALDFIRYASAFPGIEIGISDAQWFLITKTKCRHFKGGQCSIYEKQERPLLCRYYNAMQCIHKSCFEEAKPEGFMRVRYEEFNWLMETFKFDGNGNIIDGYDVNALRTHIESKWLEMPDSDPRTKAVKKGKLNEAAA